jgi:hypothetical protein
MKPSRATALSGNELKSARVVLASRVGGAAHVLRKARARF